MITNQHPYKLFLHLSLLSGADPLLPEILRFLCLRSVTSFIDQINLALQDIDCHTSLCWEQQGIGEAPISCSRYCYFHIAPLLFKDSGESLSDYSHAL